MQVSDDYQFVYYDVPKTASNFLDFYFEKYYNSYPVGYPDDQSMLKDWYGKHNIVPPSHTQNYLSVVSVRNPYDRAVSFFYYIRTSDAINKYAHSGVFKNFDTFLDWLIWTKQNHINNTPPEHLGIRYHWIGLCQVDYMSHVDSYYYIRQENIEEDLRKLPFFKETDMIFSVKINPTIAKVNDRSALGGRMSWFELYTPERQEKILRWAEEDFDKFGYDK